MVYAEAHSEMSRLSLSYDPLSKRKDFKSLADRLVM